MKTRNDRAGRHELIADPKSEEINAYLGAKLEEKRYQHVLSVRDMAVDLAGKFDADLQKTNLAAMLHDCARWMNTRQLFDAVADYEIGLDEFERISASLLHALVGAELAVDVFSVDDEEILSAVRSHTKGNRAMTLVDKILFVADFAEPNRTYPEAESVRQIANEDINQAVFEVARHKITTLLEKGLVIHPDTIAVYNGALCENTDL
ncbi:MAG: bis(5'-nucleosyl)-tetraphosphatase (symmetrical) YqeK [Candidatus Poribacteria bacterium]|nr:bis(5'-nucleosyl)-tetraphosphatase (symmetrical) YqeK [Candidatus Poribacteria bacterium]